MKALLGAIPSRRARGGGPPKKAWAGITVRSQKTEQAARGTAVAARALAQRLALDEERRRGFHDLDRGAEHA